MWPGELIEVGRCSWWAGEGEMGSGEFGRWGIGLVARCGNEEVRRIPPSFTTIEVLHLRIRAISFP